MKDRQPILIWQYGCVRCQRWHRKGIDPEYPEHILFQGKHQGPQQLPATPEEIVYLELRGLLEAAQ